MAGAGYKLFTTGQVLTAAEVNTYLMEQTIMVFNNAAARDTALSGVLAQGMQCFLKDTNTMQYYSGSAWVTLSTGGDITSVTAGTGISGGGTSGDVTITNSMATAITTKGDLVPGTGSGTFSRLAAGSDGSTLVADSSTATGLKWAAPFSQSITLLSSTNLAGASTTVSSISGAYTDLRIVIEGMGNDTAAGKFSVKFNGSSTNTSATWFEQGTSNTIADSYFQTGLNVTRTASNLFMIFFNLYNYAATYASGNATRNFDGVISYYSGAVKTGAIGGFIYNTIVDSITVANTGGNFNSGTIKIYGVK